MSAGGPEAASGAPSAPPGPAGPVSSRALGILGGTFDPIHRAHLRLAETALASLSLEGVLLIPAGEPPLKRRCHAAPAHRLRMVELAIRDRPGLATSSIEIDRAGPSYTRDTLRGLRERDPERPLWFLVGSDALAGIDAWHQPGELFELASFAVVSRGAETTPACLLALLPERLRARFERTERGWRHASGHELRALPFERLPISSSEIRARIRAGKCVRQWVPEPVVEYIRAHRLYQEDS